MGAKLGQNLAFYNSMKTLILITITLGIGLSSFAQIPDMDESLVYQQFEYQLNDPKGDELLLWSTHDLLFNEIPGYVKENFKGKGGSTALKLQMKKAEAYKKFPQYAPLAETKNILIEDFLPFNPEHAPIPLEGKKAPIDVKNMTLMMKQVIAEEFINTGIEPQLGTIHRWSPDTHKKLKKKYQILGRLNKLLVVLSKGSSSRYLVTNKENQLVDYILSRPINSINLEEMFRASYRINQGDVYLTFLTVENVLSAFWITPQREKRAVTTRLKNITNYNYQTDKFGAWYHLFGMLLYGHAYGATNAKIVSFIEAVSDKMMTGLSNDSQENKINYIGSKIGSRLEKYISKREYLSFEQNKEYLIEDFYMDLDEDFTKRVKKSL
jgi:hypothetical protein